MKSEFLDWFVAQHKPRTGSGMQNHTDQQLRDMVQAGRVADRVLACRELWDDKRQSALYAWQAREKTRENAPNASTLEQHPDTADAKRDTDRLNWLLDNALCINMRHGVPALETHDRAGIAAAMHKAAVGAA